MAYQFYNDTATLKLVENGQAKNLSKSLISLTVQGDDLVIGYDSEPNWLRIAYTDVTVPSSVSADALRNTLNGYLPEAVVATIDTTGLATSSNQTDGTQKTQIVDEAGDNLGTDENPIYVTNSTSTQGVATFQQQYNQTELLHHIWEELQEQTKLLKKIYQ